AVLNWKNAYGLAFHPIRIEAENRLDCRLPLRTAALNDEHVASDIGAHRSRLGGKGLHEFQQILRGGVSQRYERHAEARRSLIRGFFGIAASDGIAERHQTISKRV